MDFFAVKEDPLGQRRLSGIDVGADADVPHSGDICAHQSSYLFTCVKSLLRI
jgi:hypothetical protein